MRVALVHDYLYDYGGAERVLEALHELWPKAPVYTSWVDWQWLKRTKPEWREWEIHPSWFQWMPFKRTLTSPLRFLARPIWESFDLSSYDVVISSAAWFITKGVKTKPSTLHICYCHTPPRYLYGYPTGVEWERSWPTRTYAMMINPYMRMYDFESAQNVDKFVCNSEEVRGRIKKFYRREATVIYPPIGVSTKHQIPSTKQQGDPSSAKAMEGKYFLMVNRLVRMKRVDIAIKAAKKAGIKLVIVGKGADEERLRQIAGDAEKITFAGGVSDERLVELYAGCKAVVHLAEEEDFGITPVEAMSFGKPVIAANSGGVKESVVDGKTGVLVDDVSVDSVATVLKNFDTTKYRSAEIRRVAKRFSKERFLREMKSFVEKEYRNFKQ